MREADALQHICGYACFNDATLRDHQRKTTQWTIGKNFDATGGFGPCLVTADELPPGCVGLHIESRPNGQARGRGRGVGTVGDEGRLAGHRQAAY